MQRNKTAQKRTTSNQNIVPYFATVDDLSPDEVYENCLAQFAEIPDLNKVMVLKENKTKEYYFAFFNKTGKKHFHVEQNGVSLTSTHIEENFPISFMKLGENEFKRLGLNTFPNDSNTFKAIVTHTQFNEALLNKILSIDASSRYKPVGQFSIFNEIKSMVNSIMGTDTENKYKVSL